MDNTSNKTLCTVFSQQNAQFLIKNGGNLFILLRSLESNTFITTDLPFYLPLNDISILFGIVVFEEMFILFFIFISIVVNVIASSPTLFFSNFIPLFNFVSFIFLVSARTSLPNTTSSYLFYCFTFYVLIFLCVLLVYWGRFGLIKSIRNKYRLNYFSTT